MERAARRGVTGGAGAGSRLWCAALSRAQAPGAPGSPLSEGVKKLRDAKVKAAALQREKEMCASPPGARCDSAEGRRGVAHDTLAVVVSCTMIDAPRGVGCIGCCAYSPTARAGTAGKVTPTGEWSARTRVRRFEHDIMVDIKKWAGEDWDPHGIRHLLQTFHVMPRPPRLAVVCACACACACNLATSPHDRTTCAQHLWNAGIDPSMAKWKPLQLSDLLSGDQACRAETPASSSCLPLPPRDCWAPSLRLACGLLVTVGPLSTPTGALEVQAGSDEGAPRQAGGKTALAHPACRADFRAP